MRQFNNSGFGDSRPVAPAIYPASVYEIPDLDSLDAISDGESPGFIYARDAHPNADLLARQLAEFEKAEWAVICASGMAAVAATFVGLTAPGHRIVASNRLYGKTTQLFDEEMRRFGVQTGFIDCTDLAEVEKALQVETSILFVETISNPLLRVCDLPSLARLANAYHCRLVVDNTFATPVLCQPLELGARIVIESLTKMIGGHSDVTLGMVAGRGDEVKRVRAVASTWGWSPSPFDCWLTSRSLATLGLRVATSCANAEKIARLLNKSTKRARVGYPGLVSHPDHALAGTLLKAGYGNLVWIDLPGGRDAVNQLLRTTDALPFCPSLGDTRTTCSHPATTSHRNASKEEKQRQGITEGLIRISVGIDSIEPVVQAIESVIDA
jgi:cystathionine beta-lyase/cystathionine gamma-synthase